MFLDFFFNKKKTSKKKQNNQKQKQNMSMRSRVYLRDYTNLMRKTEFLQIPFTSQQGQIFQKSMRQFIWTYGGRNIIAYPRLKHRMLKFQFMTIRTNVTGDTTKVTNMNKFRDISILNRVSNFGFCLNKEQFGLIWPTTPQR